MDKLEKVEKLRERANVSYEEAKAALEANDWDLLDAMVALEKSGKTDSPGLEGRSARPCKASSGSAGKMHSVSAAMAT